MKHSVVPHYLCLLVMASLATAARSEETTNEIKFSDPTQPGTLKISLAHGDLRVRGVDAAVTTVKSEAEIFTSAPRKDGLRELASSSSFDLSEKGNVITLDASEGPRSSADFDVAVPRNTSLIVSNSWGGNISCVEVGGDIEIKNMNGRINIAGIAGGVLVETINGDVTADVRELHDGKTLSFTSMNGEILIRVPAETKANVRLRSQNGAILTDFDEKALVTKTESLGKVRPVPRASFDSKNRRRSSSDGDLNQEIHTVVREAVRVSVDAMQEAASAMREASLAAKEAVQDARLGNRDIPQPPRPALPPMTGGKIVTGALNQGGPEIQATSMNGEVKLLQLTSKK